jgi:hypothetical protein
MDQLRIDPHEINRVLALPRFYGQNEWDYRYLYRQGEAREALGRASISVIQLVGLFPLPVQVPVVPFVLAVKAGQGEHAVDLMRV